MAPAIQHSEHATSISSYFLWDSLDAIINFVDLGFVIHGVLCLIVYVASFVRSVPSTRLNTYGVPAAIRGILHRKVSSVGNVRPPSHRHFRCYNLNRIKEHLLLEHPLVRFSNISSNSVLIAVAGSSTKRTTPARSSSYSMASS